MMTGDPYADLKRHRLTPETLVSLSFVPRKVQKRREQFVMVPWTWIELLAKAHHIATYRVALHVLYRHWKGGGVPFTLSNTAMVAEGVTRWRKWEALRELEQLGLVRVERRARRSPRVTVVL
jgi:hypothetical protein